MTVVRVDLRQPTSAGRVAAGGFLTWEPTRRISEASYIVLPLPFTVPLTGGVAVVSVEPTGVDWCWKVTEHTGTQLVRHVAVPASPEIQQYSALTDVDPATFSPVAAPVAAWWARAVPTGGGDGQVLTADGGGGFGWEDPTGGGGGGGDVPDATTDLKGIVELATSTEALTGTDTTRAVTPAGLKAGLDTKAPATHGHDADGISDATTTGKALIRATNAGTVRNLIVAANTYTILAADADREDPVTGAALPAGACVMWICDTEPVNFDADHDVWLNY